MISGEQVQKACAELRDELTVQSVRDGKPALIFPLGLDILANTPPICRLLAEKLNA